MDLDLREKTESDLDRLIERRDKERRQTEGERREHELWQESVDRYHEERRLQARAEWHLYHTERAAGLRRTLQALVDYHEEQAAKFLESEANDSEATKGDDNHAA